MFLMYMRLFFVARKRSDFEIFGAGGIVICPLRGRGGRVFGIFWRFGGIRRGRFGSGFPALFYRYSVRYFFLSLLE